MEKQTDRLALNYFESVYNRVYHTENNTGLFGSLVPDGWLVVNDSVLIIENKQSVLQEKTAKEQLQKYINMVKTLDTQHPNIFCVFCSGITPEEFTIKYYDERLQPINEQIVINLFKQQDKNNPTITPQQIHNMLVKNFHYDKPNELYDILLIIMLSFVCEDIKQYYNINNPSDLAKVDKEFVNILCQTAIDTLGKQYEKYTETIKHIEFINVFTTCKTIYEAYTSDYNIVGSLLDQFKKYKQDYTTNKNEVWTEKDIVALMFNEVKPLCDHLVNKLGYISVFDPCVGGGNLLKPFINTYHNKVKLYGCDILKHYTMLNKLELLMEVNNQDLPPNVITICNPPYSKNISKYEAIEFLAKSSTHSLMCVYIFPINQLRKPTCKQYRNQILANHYVTKVLKMGNKLFYDSNGFIGAGNISIVITMRKTKLYKQLKIYDLTLYGSDRRKVPRGEIVISKNGLKQLEDYQRGLLKPEVKQVNTNSLVWVDDDGLTMDEDELREQYKNISIKLLKEKISDMIDNNENTIIDIGRELQQIHNTVNTMSFKQVKLNELFKVVNKTSGQSDSNDVPKYGATKQNEPVKYTNTYNYCIPTDENLNSYVWFVSTGDGAAGYCHRLKHRCVYLQSSFLTKTKDIIDDVNLMLISMQLHKVFSHSNTLTRQRFNTTSVYIVDN